MDFETTLTESDLDPQVRAFARQLRDDVAGPQDNFDVDGFKVPLRERIMRLFRRGNR